MQGRDTISQRLAVEGVDDFKKNLEDAGKTGEKSFEDIGKAAELANSNLSGLSNFVAGVRSSFNSTAAAMQPFGVQLRNVTHSFGELKASVGEFAEKTFPHFKEIVSLGAAAGLAGFVSFIASGAKVADQLQKTSQALGINVEDFQKLQGIAIQSGLDMEKFGAGLFRFAANLHTAQVEQLQKSVDITKTLYGDLKINGTEVIRGTAKAADDASDMVVRGNRKVSESVTEVVGQLGKTPQETAKVLGQLRSFAEQQRILILQSGGTITKTANDMALDFARAATKNNETAKKMREDFRSIGIDILPQTVGEALDKTTQSFAAKLSGLVNLWKTSTDEMGKAKLVPVGVEEGFRALADRIHNMGDATRAAEIVRTNFGRGMQNMVPLLMKGSQGIGDLATEFTHLHLRIKDVDTAIGEELNDKIELLENDLRNIKAVIAVAFAPTLIPFVEGFSKAIADNADKIRDMARGIADHLKPALEDIEHLIKGMPVSEIHTEWVKTAIQAFLALEFVLGKLVAGFKLVAGALNLVAGGFNAVFNTQFTGTGLLLAIIIGRLSGAFGVLAAAAKFAWSFVSLFWSFPYAAAAAGFVKAIEIIRTALIGIRVALLATAGAVSWPLLLVAALVAAGVALYVYRDQVKEVLQAIYDYFKPAIDGWIALFKWLYKTIADGIQWETDQFKSAIDGWGQLFKWIFGEIKSGWDWAVDGIMAGVDRIKSWFNDLIDFAKRVAAAIGSIPGFGGAAPATPMAAGGPIVGQGGIDRVPIRATAGEWVHQVAAVQKYGAGFMHAVNTMQFPESLARGFERFARMAAPPGGLAFAGGGMVPAIAPPAGSAADRVAVDFTDHAGRYFPDLLAPAKVAGAMVRAAQGDQMRSMGQRPGWYGRAKS